MKPAMKTAVIAVGAFVVGVLVGREVLKYELAIALRGAFAPTVRAAAPPPQRLPHPTEPPSVAASSSTEPLTAQKQLRLRGARPFIGGAGCVHTIEIGPVSGRPFRVFVMDAAGAVLDSDYVHNPKPGNLVELTFTKATCAQIKKVKVQGGT